MPPFLEVIVMKYENIPSLRKCPLCGHSAILRKNASKRFQVKCKKCKCCTPWTSKTEAVIAWYNMAAMYEQLYGTLEERKAEDEAPLHEDEGNP